jgi:hypothetical protein
MAKALNRDYLRQLFIVGDTRRLDACLAASLRQAGAYCTLLPPQPLPPPPSPLQPSPMAALDGGGAEVAGGTVALSDLAALPRAEAPPEALLSAQRRASPTSGVVLPDSQQLRSQSWQTPAAARELSRFRPPPPRRRKPSGAAAAITGDAAGPWRALKLALGGWQDGTAVAAGPATPTESVPGSNGPGKAAWPTERAATVVPGRASLSDLAAYCEGLWWLELRGETSPCALCRPATRCRGPYV